MVQARGVYAEEQVSEHLLSRDHLVDDPVDELVRGTDSTPRLGFDEPHLEAALGREHLYEVAPGTGRSEVARSRSDAEEFGVCINGDEDRVLKVVSCVKVGSDDAE